MSSAAWFGRHLIDSAICAQSPTKGPGGGRFNKMLKNQTKIIELEDNSEWRVDRRTRGEDIPNGPHGKPIQTWVLILKNRDGERRFVPEKRVWEWYKLPEQV